MNTTDARDERDLGAFIPSTLDDYGLDPFEFRVYSHVARRAGSGECWESIDNIADCCQMNVKTARRAIAVLDAARLIWQSPRRGKTNSIKLSHSKHWIDPSLLGQIRSKLTPTKSGSTKSGSTPSNTPTKSGTPPLPSGGTPPLPSGGTPPLPNQVPKGTPSKVLPEGSPSKGQKTEKENDRNASLPEPEVVAKLTALNSPGIESSAASNTGSETKFAAAAKNSEKEYLHDPTGDRFRNELAPWRTGCGPNDWNEDILTEYVKWADEAFSKKHSRYTAVAFFSNCEMTARRGEMQGTSKSVALCEELHQRISDRAQKLAAVAVARGDVSAPEPIQIEPETPEESAQRSRRFAELKQQLLDQKARRAG